MTRLFRNPTHLPTEYLERGDPLAERARDRQIARNRFEVEHLETWPQDQQDMLRALLLRSIRDGRPITFDWEEASSTSTSIVDFGETLGVTFRSPRAYPPYTI